MMEAGMYKAEVLSWKMGRSSKGNFQFMLRTKVVDQYDDPDDLEKGVTALEKPVVRTVYMPITENTVARVLNELKSIGYPHETLRAECLNPDKPEAVDFKKVSGGFINLRCSEDEYNNKPVERWQLSRAKIAKKVNDEEESQFNQLFGSVTGDPQ